eukprot:2903881-Pyramimonas_sp.AAC.2
MLPWSANYDVEDGYAQVGATPLHQATRMNQLEVAAVLLRKGADVNAQNEVQMSFRRQDADWEKKSLWIYTLEMDQTS